jgi:hypothetical protein
MLWTRATVIAADEPVENKPGNSELGAAESGRRESLWRNELVAAEQ